jgi:hypothetical protein
MGRGGGDFEEMGEDINDTSDGGPQMRGGLYSEPIEHDRASDVMSGGGGTGLRGGGVGCANTLASWRRPPLSPHQELKSSTVLHLISQLLTPKTVGRIRAIPHDMAITETVEAQTHQVDGDPALPLQKHR